MILHQTLQLSLRIYFNNLNICINFLQFVRISSLISDPSYIKMMNKVNIPRTTLSADPFIL